MLQHVLVFILPIFGSMVFALIEQDVMPKMLDDCYSNNPRSQQNYYYQSNCLDKYLSHLFKNNTPLLDQSALDWMDSLGQKLHIRLKRQAKSAKGGLRVRKEIRTLSNKERIDYVDAVNALKSDRTVSPNKYDAFALMHQGLAIPSAHDGVNFVSWHRYYLVLFEDALREKNNRVTLPYYDTTLDFRMKDPTQSIIWTEIFMGNGRGVVFSGPFSLWVTPSANTFLRRDIPGPDSSLIDPTKLQNVFKKKYHREILNPTAASDEENLEVHHDGVHRWIGGRNGHMNDLNLSPQDPVFWNFHCHVDYLWEQFRERQKTLGIDSEKDYPETTDPYHQPDRPMDNLKPPKTNIEGFSNSFTTKIYRYAPAPTCNNKCGGSKNVFLYCDKAKGGCVSRSRDEFIKLNGFTQIGYWYRYKIGKQSLEPLVKSRQTLSFESSIPAQFRTAAAPTITRRFKSGIVDARTRSRQRRSIEVTTEGKSLKFSLDVKLMFKPKTQNASLWHYIPFDYTNWAVAPILISYESTCDNLLDWSQSNRYLNPVKNVDTFNVTVQTDGLTYNGRHINSLIVDKRTLSSDIMAIVAFEKPTELDETKAIITVYDSFGDICIPLCRRLPNANGHKEYMYEECTGVVKITPDVPLMYMDATDPDGKNIQPYLKYSCRT